MFRSPVVKSIVFVLALGSSPAWGAGIYKWVDENGKIHFGDRPPAATGGSQAVKVKPVPEGSGTRAPSGSERSKLQRRLLDVFARERAEKKLAAAEEKKRQQELAQ